MRGREGTYPCAEDRQPCLPVRLHRRLDGIHRGENHPEPRRGQAGKDRLDQLGQIFHVRVGTQESEDACVGGRVSESGDGSLEERGDEAGVVTRKAAVAVEGPDGGGCGCAVAVLVVHDCSEGLFVSE